MSDHPSPVKVAGKGKTVY